MKSFKKAVIITLIVCVLSVTCFLIFSNRTTEVDTPMTEEQEHIQEEEEIKPVEYAPAETAVILYLPNEDMSGYNVQTIYYKGEGIEIQKRIVEDILFRYLKDLGVIDLPETIKLLELKVWNETLSINFSKEILDYKINDEVKERYVIGSVVNTLLGTTNAYTDVQFLVEGERVEKLLGTVDTWNPFMFIH